MKNLWLKVSTILASVLITHTSALASELFHLGTQSMREAVIGAGSVAVPNQAGRTPVLEAAAGLSDAIVVGIGARKSGDYIKTEYTADSGEKTTIKSAYDSKYIAGYTLFPLEALSRGSGVGLKYSQSDMEMGDYSEATRSRLSALFSLQLGVSTLGLEVANVSLDSKVLSKDEDEDSISTFQDKFRGSYNTIKLALGLRLAGNHRIGLSYKPKSLETVDQEYVNTNYDKSTQETEVYSSKSDESIGEASAANLGYFTSIKPLSINIMAGVKRFFPIKDNDGGVEASRTTSSLAAEFKVAPSAYLIAGIHHYHLKEVNGNEFSLGVDGKLGVVNVFGMVAKSMVEADYSDVVISDYSIESWRAGLGASVSF